MIQYSHVLAQLIPGRVKACRDCGFLVSNYTFPVVTDTGIIALIRQKSSTSVECQSSLLNLQNTLIISLIGATSKILMGG